MVACCCCTNICSNRCFNILSCFEATHSDDTLVYKSTTRFFGILNFKDTGIVFENTSVTNLTTTFCIERGLVQYDQCFIAFVDFINLNAIFIDRNNLTLTLSCIITVKLSFAFNFYNVVIINCKLTSITCTLTLCSHFNFEASFVNCKITFTRDISS